ncbi:MAG: hypothetical protein LC725_11250, partial [Lentisphaerae bacterium]|nr:hypothetical protein [Lentisphaerota bacterium]
ALQIEAYNLNSNVESKTYKLLERLSLRIKPEVDTFFTVKWTEKSLVFDIRCEEPDMRLIQKAKNIWDGDSIVLLIESPYHSYYHIEIDPEGRIFDADRWGSIEPRWESMADVKIEKGKDYWTANISIPIAIVGEEGAEGDPLNYVVAPRIKPGSEWFFNIARRRPREREGDKFSLQETHVLCKKGRVMFKPEEFAKLLIK